MAIPGYPVWDRVGKWIYKKRLFWLDRGQRDVETHAFVVW